LNGDCVRSGLVLHFSASIFRYGERKIRFRIATTGFPLRFPGSGLPVAGAVGIRRGGFPGLRIFKNAGKSGPANPCIGNSSEKKTFEKTMEVGLIVRRGRPDRLGDRSLPASEPEAASL